MAIWGKMFGKDKKGKKEKKDRKERKRPRLKGGWDSLIQDRTDVDFRDREQRNQYVTECLEQMADAAKEINVLTGEYGLVTSYLTDMEEIEALPKEEREELNDVARRLLTLERECRRYRDKENRMKDSDYVEIKNREGEIQEGIDKLKECEKYGELVRQDLRRLERERHVFEFRRGELEAMLSNFKGMAVIIFTAFAVCIVLLVVLQFGFDMKTEAGYLLTVGTVAVAAAILAIKHTDRERELSRLEVGINKLIQLQNKVKIRYVNHCNLHDYLRMKYNADSADILEKRWALYQQEKEERKQFAEAEAKTEYYQKQLVEKMSNYHVADPYRWQGQPGALLDQREMVEIRHELILRRQALRKQMDYNTEIAESAKAEIMDIVNQYPDYAAEILAMVDKYE